jgi:hypothetical protein
MFSQVLMTSSCPRSVLPGLLAEELFLTGSLSPWHVQMYETVHVGFVTEAARGRLPAAFDEETETLSFSLSVTDADTVFVQAHQEDPRMYVSIGRSWVLLPIAYIKMYKNRSYVLVVSLQQKECLFLLCTWLPHTGTCDIGVVGRNQAVALD